MRQFILFLASSTGRVVRLVLGGALIIAAWLFATGVTLYVALAVGAVMMLAALADVCLLAPLFGLPISDERLRELRR
jgi:hypothetical protein